MAVDLCHFSMWQRPRDGCAGLTWRQRGATCISQQEMDGPVFIFERSLEEVKAGVTAREAGSRSLPPAHSTDRVLM